MKKLLTSFLLFATGPLVFAQEPVMQVATYPFATVKNADADDQSEAALLSSFTNEVLSKNSKVALLVRSLDEIIDKERDEQMNPEYIRGKIAKQGVAMGATHTMAGFLSNCTVREEKKTGRYGPSSSFDATVSFELMLIDQATGQAVGGAKSFTTHGSSEFKITFGKSDADAALDAANRKAKKLIRNWLMSVLPSDMRILKTMDSTSKGIPTRLLIKGGIDSGLEKGADLQVMEFEMLDGVQLENLIAELEVMDVQTSASEVRVKKGGEALKAKRAANADIKILFKPDKD